MNLEEGLRWMNSEFTGFVDKDDRFYRGDMGTVKGHHKGKHDTMTNQIGRSLR